MKKDLDQTATLTLNFLADPGYKVSKGKTQISQLIVKYLGIEFSKNKETFCQIEGEALPWVSVPTTRMQLQPQHLVSQTLERHLILYMEDRQSTSLRMLTGNLGAARFSWILSSKQNLASASPITLTKLP